MSSGWLGAIKGLFVAESARTSYTYDESECPQCGLELSTVQLENKRTGEITGGAKYCEWCEWSPSAASDEPEYTREEAHERARKAYQHLGEMLEERDLL